MNLGVSCANAFQHRAGQFLSAEVAFAEQGAGFVNREIIQGHRIARGRLPGGGCQLPVLGHVLS
jgi:hypothetical protein